MTILTCWEYIGLLMEIMSRLKIHFNIILYVYVSQIIPPIQAFRLNVYTFLISLCMLDVFMNDSAPWNLFKILRWIISESIIWFSFQNSPSTKRIRRVGSTGFRQKSCHSSISTCLPQPQLVALRIATSRLRPWGSVCQHLCRGRVFHCICSYLRTVALCGSRLL
jgi:hypothetical protein